VGWLTRRKRAPAPVEERDAFSQSYHIPTWAEASGGYTYSGVNVTHDNAFGLPAVGSAIRLLSETIAQLPLNVYRGRGAEKLLAEQTWQYRLLAELPGMGDFTPFDVISDIVGCIETNGNAYLQKVKAAGQVIALIVISPDKVRLKREDGEKVFYVRDENNKETRYTASTILHIRGFTRDGSDRGMSPIEVHRQKIGSIMAQDQFQASYFGQGTNTNIAVKTPKRLTDEDAEKFLTNWRAHKAGLSNAHMPLVLQEGADLIKLGMSLADSQFVEGERMNLLQVSNIFRIPASFLGAAEPSRLGFEQDNLRFYTLALSPRLRRIEMALFTDADLFPQRAIYPQFDVSALMRTDARTLADVEHQQIQSGVRQRDEIRADHGWGPLPAQPEDPNANPGQVVPMFPVGAGEMAAAGNPPPPQNQPTQDVVPGTATDGEPRMFINVQPADVRVLPPAVNNYFEQPPAPNVLVEAPPPAEVNVPVTVEAADVRVDVQPPPVPSVTVEQAPVYVEASKAPDVHVDVQPASAPAVTVEAPQVHVEAARTPDVHVDVHQPPAPNITVEAPPVPAVTVEAPAQRIDVHIPDQRPRRSKAKRMADGTIEVTYEDNEERSDA
jgi:HK97 family phage portal protein